MRFVVIIVFLIGIPVGSIINGRHKLWQQDLKLWDCFESRPAPPSALNAFLSAPKFGLYFDTSIVAIVIVCFLWSYSSWKGLFFWLPVTTIHVRLLFDEIKDSFVPLGFCGADSVMLGLNDKLFLFSIIILVFIYKVAAYVFSKVACLKYNKKQEKRLK